MGRVGACADNAAMETILSLLQKHVLNTRRWSTREELRLAIVTWIEATYHRRRRQRGLGKLTPIEFETISRSLMRSEASQPRESTELGADPASETWRWAQRRPKNPAVDRLKEAPQNGVSHFGVHHPCITDSRTGP